MGKNQTNGTGLTLALIPAHTFIFHLQYDGFRMAVLLSCPVFLSVSEAPISSIRARNRVLYSVRFFPSCRWSLVIAEVHVGSSCRR
jgi:hypothetical protein